MILSPIIFEPFISYDDELFYIESKEPENTNHMVILEVYEKIMN